MSHPTRPVRFVVSVFAVAASVVVIAVAAAAWRSFVGEVAYYC